MGFGRYILKAARLAAKPAGWPPPLPPLEQGDADAASQIVTLSLSAGETSATLYHPSSAARGVVVLLHAGGADRACVWPWARALRDIGFACLAPDLDGHGSNTRPYTSVSCAAEVALAALDAADGLGLPAPTAMLGGSLGGVVALRAAALRAEVAAAVDSQRTIGALTLLATPYTSPFWQMLSPNLLRSAWEGQGIVGRPVRRDGPRPRFAAFRDSLAHESLLENARAVAPRPLLLVCGRYDPFAPPQQGAAYRRVHGSATLQVVLAAHAGALYGAEAVAAAATWLGERLRPYEEG
ncbi:MAG: alpha/beta fold hydrolase [Anaerolineae bacterium]